MPAKQCSICTHPRRQAAEALLAGGLSPRKTAKQLNISYPSLERHRTGCLVRAMQQREAAKPASLSNAQGELDRIHSETLCILEAARSCNDHSAALQAIQQARRNIELAARMAGVLEPADGTKTTTLTLQGLMQIVEVHRASR